MKTMVISACVSLIGTTLSAWLGGWDQLLQWLIAFMIFDYLTGLAAAVRRKRVDSEVMYWGGLRKALMLVVIAIATGFDQLAAGDMPFFRTMAIYYYLSREGLSVVENLGLLGVPIPPFLRAALEQLQEQSNRAERKGGDSNGS